MMRPCVSASKPFLRGGHQRRRHRKTTPSATKSRRGPSRRRGSLSIACEESGDAHHEILPDAVDRLQHVPAGRAGSAPARAGCPWTKPETKAAHVGVDVAERERDHHDVLASPRRRISPTHRSACLRPPTPCAGPRRPSGSPLFRRWPAPIALAPRRAPPSAASCPPGLPRRQVLDQRSPGLQRDRDGLPSSP